MKLYLSSQKFGNDSTELENWLLKYEKKFGNKLILISDALEFHTENERKQILSKDEYYLNITIGFDVKVIQLKNYFGKYDELMKEIDQCHAFFAVGGNVFALRKAMQLSKFDNYLKTISNKDEYLYGGYSAGICVLGPTLHGLDLVDDAINPYTNEPVLYDGIGLLDYMPLPHYDTDYERMKYVVDYCKKNNIKNKTLNDGDVIIEDIDNELER